VGTENAAGLRAYQQQNYAEAETHFRRAFRQAEEFGELDARLLSTINNLAAVQYAEGNYASAEQLYRRALSIWRRLWTDARK